MMSDTTEMVAGRELDALVAERVMGWTGIERHIRGGIAMPPWPSGLDPVTSAYRTIPRYSTSIADAWLVVERCGLSVVQSDDGWYAVKPEDIHHSSVRGTAYPTITLVYPEQQYPEPADTPALAICRAALEAHR